MGFNSGFKGLNQASSLVTTVLKDKRYGYCITVLKAGWGPALDCEVPADGSNKVSEQQVYYQQQITECEH